MLFIFNVARYLTVSLRVPVVILRRGMKYRVLTGWAGGTHGHQKCPFTFFHFNIYETLYLYILIKKLTAQISCGFYILFKLGVAPINFKKFLERRGNGFIKNASQFDGL